MMSSIIAFFMGLLLDDSTNKSSQEFEYKLQIINELYNRKTDCQAGKKQVK